MRYSTPVYFQKVAQGAYNENTGDYAADTVTEVKEYASVTDTGENALKIVYGALKEGSQTVRLQHSYTKAFDFLRIGDKVYKVDAAKLKKRVFIVSEVQ